MKMYLYVFTTSFTMSPFTIQLSQQAIKNVHGDACLDLTSVLASDEQCNTHQVIHKKMSPN